MGDATSVTIPDGITNVCNHAFAGNTTVQEIIIPEGVKVVYGSAIWGTTSLTHLDLSDSLTYFGGFPYDTKRRFQELCCQYSVGECNPGGV